MENNILISFRTDKETKENADSVLKELGLPMSTALNIFLKQCARVKGIPFPLILNTPVKEKELLVNKSTTENERIIPLFLDLTGTTDILLNGGVENVKRFFDAIRRLQYDLDARVLITIVTGSDCEAAHAKYISFKNLADNDGLVGLFAGVVAEYCGYLVNDDGVQELIRIAEPIEKNKQKIEELAKRFGGSINPNNRSYYNVKFDSDDVIEEDLNTFAKDVLTLINDDTIEALVYFDDYGKEVDIKSKSHKKSRAVNEIVKDLSKKYVIKDALVGGDSKKEDLDMYLINKDRFAAMGINFGFIAPKSIGDLSEIDGNIFVGKWDNAFGIIDCIYQLCSKKTESSGSKCKSIK